MTFREVLRQRRTDNLHRRRIERKLAGLAANAVRAEQSGFLVCVQLYDLVVCLIQKPWVTGQRGLTPKTKGLE